LALVDFVDFDFVEVDFAEDDFLPDEDLPDDVPEDLPEPEWAEPCPAAALSASTGAPVSTTYTANTDARSANRFM
jgi:hypothetical protein